MKQNLPDFQDVLQMINTYLCKSPWKVSTDILDTKILSLSILETEL